MWPTCETVSFHLSENGIVPGGRYQLKMLQSDIF